ncbi:MAG: DUF1667 domain-containing protein [Erysipelotrichaceae bacterium]|nr:DUF1667 domain-containing protein [Erysipelotrichaceae bacterium]
MTELICIGCPRGCHLKVDEENGYTVTGNSCPVGAEYGANELRNPVRTLTTTVKITGAAHEMLPVKTDHPLPKGLQFEAMQLLKSVKVASPVHMGDVIVENILDTGVNIIAARDM